MKCIAWFVKFLFDPYALGPIRFGKPVGKRSVFKWARKFEKTKRLRVGFRCWPAYDKKSL